MIKIYTLLIGLEEKKVGKSKKVQDVALHIYPEKESFCF